MAFEMRTALNLKQAEWLKHAHTLLRREQRDQGVFQMFEEQDCFGCATCFLIFFVSCVAGNPTCQQVFSQAEDLSHRGAICAVLGTSNDQGDPLLAEGCTLCLPCGNIGHLGSGGPGQKWEKDKPAQMEIQDMIYV